MIHMMCVLSEERLNHLDMMWILIWQEVHTYILVKVPQRVHYGKYCTKGVVERLI